MTIRSAEEYLRLTAFVRQAFLLCDHCAAGVPHHTNAGGSIGGSDRTPRWDLHHLERGDLVECTAYEHLLAHIDRGAAEDDEITRLRTTLTSLATMHSGHSECADALNEFARRALEG